MAIPASRPLLSHDPGYRRDGTFPPPDTARDTTNERWFLVLKAFFLNVANFNLNKITSPVTVSVAGSFKVRQHARRKDP